MDIVKLFKRKWYWFMVTPFMITIYFWAFHFHTDGTDLSNSKGAVLGTVPDYVYYRSRPTVVNRWNHEFSISGQNIGSDLLHSNNAVLGTVPDDVYYRPRPTVVNRWDHNFSISGQNICQQTKPYLLLLILTVPKNGEKRNAIRETWTRTKNWPNFKSSITIKPVFLFAKYKDNKDNSLVLNESAKYGDIVVGNFVDSYLNLTLKVLTGLYWARRYCAGAKFIAKMDDDTFINIPLLYKHLQTIPQLNYTILGYLVTKAKAHKRGKHKYFPYNFFPPFGSGNLYIATPETFFALLDVAPYQPRIESEDVFITGILAKIAKVRLRAYPRRMYLPFNRAAACEFVKNTKLYSKDYESKDVREAMQLIKDPKNKCK